MKMSVYEIKQTFIGWGKFLLFLPVMSIFAAGFLGLGSSLDALITGQANANNISPILSVAIMAVYTFVCIRMNWDQLHFSTILLCIFMLLTDSSMNILTKILMGILAVVILILPYKIKIPARSSRAPSRKTAGKAVVRPAAAPVIKPVVSTLPPEDERRYQKTLAKLPSNPQAFRQFCATRPVGEAQRMAKDMPTIFFHYVPYREGLQFIYNQNQENAMVMVDVYIKFDPQGNLISL